MLRDLRGHDHQVNVGGHGPEWIARDMVVTGFDLHTGEDGLNRRLRSFGCGFVKAVKPNGPGPRKFFLSLLQYLGEK